MKAPRLIQESLIRALLVISLTIALSLPIFAQPGDRIQLGNGEACGTQAWYELKLRQRFGTAVETNACTPLGLCDDPATRDSYLVDSLQDVKIVRLYFHVFRDDDGSNAATTADDVAQQVVVLNQHYAPLRIQFDYQMRFLNSTQFRNLTSDAEFDQMKTAFAIQPDSILNIYVASVNVDGQVFSFGTFPWDPDALTARGGVVMNRTQFYPFGLSTLTHEIGHNLGLWHTHHGVSEVAQCGPCYEEAQGTDHDYTGDLCADTDPTPTNFNCAGPGGNDTCSGFPWGPTDPQNFMGYAPQSCRVEFSPQQMARMHCWIQDVLTSYLIQVTLDADSTFGPAPLTVNFTGFSPKTVDGWTWDFGDGQISHLQNPTHTYNEAGVYAVSLTIDAADGDSYTTNQPDFVFVTADTLVVDSAKGLPSQSVRVDVSINNELPLTRVTIPFSWSGPLGLSFDSVSTEGLRTSYLTFANGGLFVTNNDFSNQRAIRELLPGAANPIVPGTGPVLSLFFTTPPFQLPDSNPIKLISYGLRDPSLEVIPGSYQPSVIQGQITMTCCEGNVGNVDGDPTGNTDIGDLTALINHLFITFEPLECESEANCNGDPENIVDISDLSALIDHLFINFPALPACQ